MQHETQTLLALLVILSIGLVMPEIFKRTIRLPFVTSLILLGAFLGPHGFDVIESNEVIEFFGFLGFTFLMLMAGLETHIKKVRGKFGTIGFLASVNALIPFATGVVIARIFSYSWVASLLLGTIFVSSSVAVIVPYLNNKFLEKEVKNLLLPAFVFEDLLSIIMLAVVLQSVAPITTFPLPLYFAILFLSIAVLYFAIPALAKQFIRRHIFFAKEQHYEDQLRFTLVLLIAVLLYFSALGVHPILAAFLVGMILSDIVTSRKLATKIHTMGYGLFAPVFFFIVGMEMDLHTFLRFDFGNILIISVIVGLILSKFLSGYIAARITKITPRVAAIFGTISTAQLTTTLAAAYAASALGLFDDALVTAIVTLSIVTNTCAPIALQMLVSKNR